MLPASTVKAEPPHGMGIGFQFFYDNLSPYGTWVSYPSHGYVWIPSVAPGFRPYFSSGHWVYTPEGWMWVSFYDWGWAPFHYGSWLYDPFYGWMWVPGYHWAPAWVTWGYYSGYYGWAPLSPGISFNFSYCPPVNYWVFVPPRNVTVSGWNNTYYTSYGNRIAFDNNTSITNVKNINVVENAGTYEGQRFSAGPPKAEFERTANTKVKAVSVSENNSPGKTRLNGDNISIYRPVVDARDRSEAKPSKVAPLESMKRSSGGERKENADRIRSNDGRGVKSREEQKQATPEIKRERTPEKSVPAQREQPKTKERKQDVNGPSEQKRNENVQPRTKERQNIERDNRYEERPHQVPQRIERSPRHMQPQAVPERRQRIERTVPREPRYQPQPQQREKEMHRNPK